MSSWGDQVLRLVAARLAEIRGGGTAHRHGGELVLITNGYAVAPHGLPLFASVTEIVFEQPADCLRRDVVVAPLAVPYAHAMSG